MKQNKPLHKTIVLADDKHTPLNLSKQEISQPIDRKAELKKNWASKELHGRHYHQIHQSHVDTISTNQWLKNGNLQPETEGFALAIQDQVINTLNYSKFIMKTNIPSDKCRKCHTMPETIQHITNSCPILVSTQYKERHDLIAKIIHREIGIKYKLTKDPLPYYKYTPTTILENEKYKLYWDVTLQTDKTVKHNRPDITLFDKENKETYLIEIGIPADHNLKNRWTEKMEKYQPLAADIQKIWKQKKIHVIPIVISSTGITHIHFKRNLEKIKLNPHLHTQIQKAVILKTCNLTRLFLNQPTD